MNQVKASDVVSIEEDDQPEGGSHYCNKEETSCGLRESGDSLGTVPVLYPWLEVDDEVEAFMKGTRKFRRLTFHSNHETYRGISPSACSATPNL